MDNLLSYCGLVDARISTSERDLPVHFTRRVRTIAITVLETFHHYKIIQSKPKKFTKNFVTKTSSEIIVIKFVNKLVKN